ncbi:MAG: HEPN domain-containing protein [Acidobacteria bacterium]|nr:HEPN domain-containing protein [Acidobacteriota bacterium]
MSRLRQANGDDFPEAAGKHMQDSGLLLAEGRHDGAAYLAGYVVECALKTLIQLEAGQVRYSHDLSALDQELDKLAAQASSRAGKLYLRAQAPLRASTILNDWTPEQRYRSPEIGAADAARWHQEAAGVYRRIIGPLLLAGAI